MEQNIVFFDGVCNLCSGVVQWLIKHDKKNVLVYASLQGETAKQNLVQEELKNIDSIVYFKMGVVYTKSTAVLMIAKDLALPYSIAGVLFVFPRMFRDYVYDWVARNRYKWFGKKLECWLPDASLLAKFKV